VDLSGVDNEIDAAKDLRILGFNVEIFEF